MTPASRVIDFVYDRLQIDEEWSTRDAGGFTWCAGPLALRVWHGAPREVEGISMTAVHIETDLVNGVVESNEIRAQLAGINRLATLSAYVWSARDRTVRLHASVSVTEDNWPLARLLALHATAIQVADAHAESAPLAGIFGGSVARTIAPNGRVRLEPDVMLEVTSVYQQRGEHGSPWSADELASLVPLEPRPWSRASSEADHFEATLPWHTGRESRLELDTRIVHPALGSGLQLRLRLPVDAEPSVVHDLNTADITEPDAHQLGAWGLDDEAGVVFTSFMPAAAFVPNLTRSLVYHLAARNDWARELLV